MKLPKDERVLFLNLILNLFLSLLKGIIGFIGNSRALVADAVNSLTDSIATVAVFGGLRLSKKPSDDDHLYGHGKLEAIVSASIGIMMLVAVYYIIQSVVTAFTKNISINPSYLTVIASLLSIIIKAFLYTKNRKAANETNSLILKASAKDHLQDIFSTSGVLISIISAIIGTKHNIPFLLHLEPIAAFVMAIVIAKTAYGILKDSYMHLTDAAPENAILLGISKIANDINDIDHIDWLKGRYVGRKLLIDMAISIEGNHTITFGHSLAAKLEDKIKEQYPFILHVLIHVNPTSNH